MQKDHLTIAAFVGRQSCHSYPLGRKKPGELACCIFSFPPAEAGKSNKRKLNLPFRENIEFQVCYLLFK